MKMNKRKILIAAVALCMVAVLGGGTLAYFTSSKEVTNTFRTADSDNPDPDSVFSIKVFETDGGNETTDGVEYRNLQPGDIEDKDPTVRNTGAYDAYVRLTVTVTKGQEWLEALRETAPDITETDIITGFEPDKWTFVKPDDSSDILWSQNTESNTLTYILYLNEALAPGEEETLFTQFEIPTAFDVEQMVAINGFELTVKGEAIQAANTGDTPQEAFTLYDAQESTTAP